MDPDYTAPIGGNIGPPLGGENLLFEPKYINLDYVFNKMYVFFQKLLNRGGGDGGLGVDVSVAGDGSFDAGTGGGFLSHFNFDLFFDDVNTIISIIIIILLAIIIYSVIKIFEVRKKEQEFMDEQIEKYRLRQKEKEERESMRDASRNEKWVRIVHHINSPNENDWRQAIIESDNMLFSLMEKLGFKGGTLGEKLKSAASQDFRNLNIAWEVHAVRNKIAHEGTDYILTHKEAQRVVALYEQIFRDYDAI